MAEPRLLLQYDGQEVQQSDLTAIADNAGLADDRVLAELLRMAPYDGSTVARAIVPYNGRETTSTGTRETVSEYLSGGVPAAGPKVTVNPFRAIIGSRTGAADGALANWRDIRSAVFVGSSSSLSADITLSAADATNPRWDLVYARVDVDAASASTAERFVKDPATSAVSSQTVSTATVCTVTVLVKDGTANATPAYPDIDADGTGYYLIPLAYVYRTAAVTTIYHHNIHEVAPIVVLASAASGATTVRPANQQYAVGGTVLTHIPWYSELGLFRPRAFIPPGMVGAQSLLIAMTLGGTLPSHADGDIVDDSCDWRNRLFRWDVAVGSSNGPDASSLPFAQHSDTNTFAIPSYEDAAQLGQTASGMGQSFRPLATDRTIAIASHGNIPVALAVGESVTLYVDKTTGALKTNISALGGVTNVIFWLTATGAYS